MGILTKTSTFSSAFPIGTRNRISNRFARGLALSLNGQSAPEFQAPISEPYVVQVGRGTVRGSPDSIDASGGGYGYRVDDAGTNTFITGKASSGTNHALVELPAATDWTFQCVIDNPGLGSVAGQGFWRFNAVPSGSTFVINNTTRRPWVRVANVDVLKATTGPEWSTGRTLNMLVRMRSAASVDVWWDGKQQHSATHSTAQTAGAVYVLGYQNNLDSIVTGVWRSVRFWRRALSDAEMQELAADPWRFYEPAWVPTVYTPAASPSFNAAWAMGANVVIRPGTM